MFVTGFHFHFTSKNCLLISSLRFYCWQFPYPKSVPLRISLSVNSPCVSPGDEGKWHGKHRIVEHSASRKGNVLILDIFFLSFPLLYFTVDWTHHLFRHLTQKCIFVSIDNMICVLWAEAKLFSSFYLFRKSVGNFSQFTKWLFCLLFHYDKGILRCEQPLSVGICVSLTCANVMLCYVSPNKHALTQKWGI